VVLGVTLLVAVLPTRWLGWTSDMADIVRIPIMPLAGVGSRLAGAMRPVNIDGNLVGDVADLREMESQRSRIERLLLAEQLRVAELETQLRHLQDLPPDARTRRPPVLIKSEVTGRRPDHPASGVELHVGPELAGRVSQGDAVTWDGRWLVGRVTRVSDFRLSALPVTHPDVGPLMGVILPEDEAVDVASSPRILLKQDGSGNLIGEIDRRSPVAIGDRVILADRSWPSSLQAFKIGRVAKMDDVDAAPLRVRLLVEPEVHLHQLPWVVIVGQDARGVAP
tara:strand:+ start:8040 stop:8879 length:840 start_codon:yes stop_codon:yes gene_type:complete